MNKLPVLNLNQDIITSNRVGIRTCSDYSPFGVELDGRRVSGGYRYGYQGSEKDNETKGNGNSYTTEFRQLDPRLGRWLSVDPLSFKFPWQSTYIAFDNNPISLVDRLGSETEGGPGDGYKKNKDGSRSKTNANGTKTYDAPGFSSVNLPANAKVLGTMQDVDGNKDGAIYNNGVKYQASVGDLAKFEVNDVTYTAQFFKGQFIDFENDNGKKYVFNPQSNDVEISVNQSYFDLMANEIIENTRKILTYYKLQNRPTQYVFPILLHEKLTPEQIHYRKQKVLKTYNSRLKEIALLAGVEAKLTSYVARHSFATILKMKGTSIAKISEMMGHADVSVTMNYLKEFSNEDLDIENRKFLNI